MSTDLTRQLVLAVKANPRANYAQLGEVVGVSAQRVNEVLISEEFALALAGEAAAHERLSTLMNAAIDVIEKRFKGVVSDNLAVKTLELCMKGLGIGGDHRPVTPADEMLEHLERMGERLVGLLERKTAAAQTPRRCAGAQITEGEFSEAKSVTVTAETLQ